MKTIEEGAKELVDAPCDWLCANCTTDKMSCRFYNDKESFKAGAEWRKKELTRWHDPKVELPPTEKIVLVKTTYGCGYVLAERDDEGWWLAPPEEWELPAERVVGWRDIHKNK